MGNLEFKSLRIKMLVLFLICQNWNNHNLKHKCNGRAMIEFEMAFKLYKTHLTLTVLHRYIRIQIKNNDKNYILNCRQNENNLI